MSAHIASGRWVVWATFFVGAMFQVMPLPELAEVWRPDWLVLVMIYWAMALPHRYSVLTAFTLGLFLDVLLGATLGVRALALSLVVYIVVLHSMRFRNFPRWQQSLMVASLIFLYHFVIFWAQYAIVGDSEFVIDLFLPSISCVAVWWWLFWVLRNLRRSYGVK
ncbi:rod shape-determining protein MreD [Shewanella sp. WXL01]|uniref:Rod shape-determining protein MreD n=1 Tax=Shewanella maritima TaxID=2520507 RepID=A0A411PGU8_9GAMM|nr:MULTISPECIES: rod shape-determining protein MreD [Shewanella]NKF49083.1 rod shape-determining protein MreD [Shewanella sp. WXL01]QBF82775.1 rod shape-determining protein MreD [Shewanella maritima]